MAADLTNILKEIARREGANVLSHTYTEETFPDSNLGVHDSSLGGSLDIMTPGYEIEVTLDDGHGNTRTVNYKADVDSDRVLKV